MTFGHWDMESDSGLSVEDEEGRNSPSSPVCSRDPAEFGDRGPTDATGSGEDTPRTDLKDNAAASVVSGEESDNTPRSELPAAVPSPGIWQPPTPTQPQPALTGQPSYFSPQPMRYYPTALPASTTSSKDPSPTPSHHGSSASVDLPSRDRSTPLDQRGRPSVHRDVSIASTASTQTVRPASTDFIYQSPANKRALKDYPHFPNQAYSALHSQQHFERYREPGHRDSPHVLRTRSSHPSQNSSYSVTQRATPGYPHTFDRTVLEQGSKTAGNSPASSPGLFSPPSPPVQSNVGVRDEQGFYPSPYLHFTHRQAPKETHVADVDVDPISGRKIVNQYEIIDELGRGVHGKVKLGRSLHTGQYVAIKIVDRYSKRRRLGKNNNHEDKIRREIAILKKARHPNIVGLLEVIDDPSRRKVYIILEHVEMGEVKWRTKGNEAIARVEYRRYQRLVRNEELFDPVAVEEDERIIWEAKRKRERRDRRRLRDLQRQRLKGTEHEHTWSFEHGGDSDEDEDEENISRISSSTTVASERQDADDNKVNEGTTSNDLEGTMYGAYLPDVPRGRTPSVAGSASSQIHDSKNLKEADYIPEHFQYVPLMTLPAARAAFRDTVLGVEYLHYNNVIHRDIKPANLLQTKDHRIKISDFGVSYLGRQLDEENGEEQSESDAPDADEAVELAKTVGTPAFYAPELCRTDFDSSSDTPPVSHQIDIWALGVTLYCLIFGRVPFHDQNTFVLMRLIADTDAVIPRWRLKAVDERSSSRPDSHGRYFPMNSNKRSPFELDYEPIDEDLYDLFKRLFQKDPRRRITIKEIKRHPWVLQDIPDKVGWVEETDPRRQTEGRRIEVSKKELEEAVVPLSIVDHIRSGIRRIGGALGLGKSSSTRKRAKSSATATPSDTGLSSAASSSSTISQDARRPSLRVDESIFAALKSSRESDHPLSHSVTASPEGKEHAQFFAAPSSRPQTPRYLREEHDHPSPLSSSLRPTLPDRAHSTMSTSTSVRTIRQSDIPRDSRESSPSLPPALPGTPLALDTPGGSNLGGIFGGVPRRLMNSVRGRDRPSKYQGAQTRAQSSDRLVGADDDAHAGPSIALSNAFAAGHVDPPAILKENSTPASPMVLSSSEYLHLHPEMQRRMSRQSSISSVASHPYHYAMHDEELPALPQVDQSSFRRDSSDERFSRAKEDFVRRRVLQEHQQQDRPKSEVYPQLSGDLSQSACPPSPDDDLYFHNQAGNGLFKIPQYSQNSSIETSPTGYDASLNPRGLFSSSSEDQFTSTSKSTSNPSIPSIISASSSIAPDDHDQPSMETLKELTARSSDDTLNPKPVLPIQDDYEGYAPDHVVESADDEDDESDDDFIEMTRIKPSAQGSGRGGSVSNADVSRRRLRRSTGGSRKSTRSGSNGTVKKVRSHDTDDDGAP